MGKRRKERQSTTQRIHDLINKIEDEEVKEVVQEAMKLEVRNRSLDLDRFPYKYLRQIVENTISKRTLK